VSFALIRHVARSRARGIPGLIFRNLLGVAFRKNLIPCRNEPAGSADQGRYRGKALKRSTHRRSTASRPSACVFLNAASLRERPDTSAAPRRDGRDASDKLAVHQSGREVALSGTLVHRTSIGKSRGHTWWKLNGRAMPRMTSSDGYQRAMWTQTSAVIFCFFSPGFDGYLQHSGEVSWTIVSRQLMVSRRSPKTWQMPIACQARSISPRPGSCGTTFSPG